jgi:hypothetical protein
MHGQAEEITRQIHMLKNQSAAVPLRVAAPAEDPTETLRRIPLALMLPRHAPPRRWGNGRRRARSLRASPTKLEPARR